MEQDTPFPWPEPFQTALGPTLMGIMHKKNPITFRSTARGLSDEIVTEEKHWSWEKALMPELLSLRDASNTWTTLMHDFAAFINGWIVLPVLKSSLMGARQRNSSVLSVTLRTQ